MNHVDATARSASPSEDDDDNTPADDFEETDSDVTDDLSEETGIDLTDASELDADNVPADEEFDRTVMNAPQTDASLSGRGYFAPHDHLPVARTAVHAVLPGHSAIHDHRIDAFGRLRRCFVVRGIAHRGRVEDHHVGMVTWLERSALMQTEVARDVSPVIFHTAVSSGNRPTSRL
jgi:hypothetical protein